MIPYMYYRSLRTLVQNQPCTHPHTTTANAPSCKIRPIGSKLPCIWELFGLHGFGNVHQASASCLPWSSNPHYSAPLQLRPELLHSVRCTESVISCLLCTHGQKFSHILVLMLETRIGTPMRTLEVIVPRLFVLLVGEPSKPHTPRLFCQTVCGVLLFRCQAASSSAVSGQLYRSSNLLGLKARAARGRNHNSSAAAPRHPQGQRDNGDVLVLAFGWTAEVSTTISKGDVESS